MRPHADITLDFPIMVDGVEVKALRMRRPKARDELKFMESKGSEGRRSLEMFADLCEMPLNTILDIDAADLAKMAEQLGKFKGQETPTT